MFLCLHDFHQIFYILHVIYPSHGDTGGGLTRSMYPNTQTLGEIPYDVSPDHNQNQDEVNSNREYAKVNADRREIHDTKGEASCFVQHGSRQQTPTTTNPHRAPGPFYNGTPTLPCVASLLFLQRWERNGGGGRGGGQALEILHFHTEVLAMCHQSFILTTMVGNKGRSISGNYTPP